jgi:O-methyltransferase involved in polyketide biosynthesis
VLAAHGFSTAIRTFYVWEAVTQYLTKRSHGFFGITPEASRPSSWFWNRQ